VDAHSTDEADSFEATTGPAKESLVAMAVGQVALLVVTGAGAMALDDVGPWAAAGIALAGLVGIAALTLIAIRRRPVRVTVTDDTIAITGAGSFPIESAALGPWEQAHVHVVGGTILHLARPTRAIRIGGVDRAPETLPMTRPPADHPDVWMRAADFDALVDALGLSGRPSDA